MRLHNLNVYHTWTCESSPNITPNVCTKEIKKNPQNTIDANTFDGLSRSKKTQAIKLRSLSDIPQNITHILLINISFHFAMYYLSSYPLL